MNSARGSSSTRICRRGPTSSWARSATRRSRATTLSTPGRSSGWSATRAASKRQCSSSTRPRHTSARAWRRSARGSCGQGRNWEELLVAICERAGIAMSAEDAQREWEIGQALRTLRGSSGDAALQLHASGRSREQVKQFLDRRRAVDTHSQPRSRSISLPTRCGAPMSSATPAGSTC